MWADRELEEKRNARPRNATDCAKRAKKTKAITYRWATRRCSEGVGRRGLRRRLLPHGVLLNTHLRMHRDRVVMVEERVLTLPNGPPIAGCEGQVEPGLFMLPAPMPIFCWLLPSPGVH